MYVRAFTSSLCLLCLLSPRSANAQADPPDEQEAVRKGLAYVQEKSLTWR